MEKQWQYKIAVLGPIPRDHITTYKGQEMEKYGCVTLPVSVLAKLFAGKARIYPVSHIRKVDEHAIREIMQGLPGVSLRCLDSSQDQGDIIRLRYIDQNERVKTMSGFMNPITVDDVKQILDCDAFLFLPVTDFEISLEALRFIKAHSSGMVIFDAHGPTKTMTSLGDRLFKLWIDRDLWLPYIDVLKMNLREAKCCWFKHRYSLEELEDDEPLSVDDLPDFARHCFKFGVKALYITLDVCGCLVYYLEDDELQEELIPAVPIDVMNIVDSTGCGDSFAGGLTYGLLMTGDYRQAAYFANVLGAQCLQGTSCESFQPLEKTEEIIKVTYTQK